MESELRRVVDALPGLVWTARPDGHIDYLNQRWCEYTGLSVEEAYGRGWQTAIHPEDLPELLERWQSVVASGGPRGMEARLQRFDGEYRWFLFSINPLVDASGRVVKWCGMNIDIEGRRRPEEAQHAPWWLRSSERKHHFRSINDSIPALCALMTPAGELELVNRQILEYFGATLEELKGWATGYCFHPEDRPDALARWRESLETGHPYESEARLRRADGVYRWFHMRSLPLRDTEGYRRLVSLAH
jgi:PAS domain S-box-containing protein